MGVGLAGRFPLAGYLDGDRLAGRYFSRVVDLPEAAAAHLLV